MANVRNRATLAIIVAVLSLPLSGCGPGAAPYGVDVVVRQPPSRRSEVRGARPGPGYVWVQGHFAWQSGNYVWIAGQWERPPQPRYHSWESGHWRHVRGGWIWVDGRWR
ncbi:MAG: YXWGXW repeat-containing protein [Gemmatimonadales bacterium]